MTADIHSKPRRPLARGDPRLAKSLAPPPNAKGLPRRAGPLPLPPPRSRLCVRPRLNRCAGRGRPVARGAAPPARRLGHAARHGARRWHVEAGVSGAVPFHERPEGGKLWGELRKGDTLVAAKLDRMFRSASDCLAVVEAFKARGVILFLLDLNGGADDVSGNGIARLFLTIVAAFAEFERDRIGERIRATKRRRRRVASTRAAVRRSASPTTPSSGFGPGARAAGGAAAHPASSPAEGLSPRKISADLAKRGVKLSHVTVGKIIAGGGQRHEPGMREEHIKARILRNIARRDRDYGIVDMVEASRRGRLLQSEPEKPLPDVPLHKRGFGVMDEDGS